MQFVYSFACTNMLWCYVIIIQKVGIFLIRLIDNKHLFSDAPATPQFVLCDVRDATLQDISISFSHFLLLNMWASTFHTIPLCLIILTSSVTVITTSSFNTNMTPPPLASDRWVFLFDHELRREVLEVTLSLGFRRVPFFVA